MKNFRIISLCVVVVFIRIVGFAENISLPDGARGVTIAAGVKGK